MRRPFRTFAPLAGTPNTGAFGTEAPFYILAYLRLRANDADREGLRAEAATCRRYCVADCHGMRNRLFVSITAVFAA